MKCLNPNCYSEALPDDRYCSEMCCDLHYDMLELGDIEDVDIDYEMDADDRD